MLEEKLKEFISINEKRAMRNLGKIGKESKENENSPSSMKLATEEDNELPA